MSANLLVRKIESERERERDELEIWREKQRDRGLCCVIKNYEKAGK